MCVCVCVGGGGGGGLGRRGGVIVLCDNFSTLMAISVMLDNTMHCYSVYRICCYVLYIQKLMNVTQTMEAVITCVPTHQDLGCVAAGRDSDLLVMAERV